MTSEAEHIKFELRNRSNEAGGNKEEARIPGLCLRKIFFLYLGLVISAISMVPPSLHAQVVQGALTGVVTDSSGAVLTGASVTVKSPETGFTREAKTNQQGIFNFNDLQPGIYTVTVSAEGFANFKQNSTPIQANNTARVNASMRTATTAQEVTVTDAPPVLQTDRAETNYNLSEQQLEELPATSTTGRNYQSLYKLVPGATPPAEQNSQAANPQRSQAVNINGQSAGANSTRIDGALDQHPYLPINVAYVPPEDAIQTVNVVTSAFNAEQGIAGGAAVNVILKSGTNAFHGSVFEYNTITQFNARGVFQTQITLPRLPKYIFNQYGGSVGGPIVKDKLFFFADWESTHISQAISAIASVPVAQLRAGNFAGTGTTIYDPSTGNATGKGKTAFANNQVPISKAAGILLAKVPLPNYGAAGAQVNNYFASGSNLFSRDNVDAKINDNLSESTQIYGHYSVSRDTIIDPQIFGPEPGGPTLDGGQPGSASGLIQLVGLNGTHTFTPHVLLDANAGYTRFHVGAAADDLKLGDYGTQTLGIPGTNYNGSPLYAGIPSMNISNYTGLGNTNGASPFSFRDAQYTGNVNLSYVRGRHNLRFGGEYIHTAINHFQPQMGNPRGQFNFTGGATTQGGSNPNNFNSFADFLLGDATSATKGIQTTNPIGIRWSSFGFYAQDTWAATKNLTVTFGARYEYYTLPVHDHAGIYQYDPSIRSTVTDVTGTHTVGTVLIGGKGNTPQFAGIDNGKGMIVPRLGINYRVNDKTVIRSGFGITVDPQNFIDARNAYPSQVALTLNGLNSYTVATTFTSGLPAIAIPDINSGRVPLPYNISTYSFPTKERRGYIKSYNLAFQRELPASFVADVAYVGAGAIRQLAEVNINAAPIGGGTAGRALNTTYGANTSIADILLQIPFRGANYNALQTQLSRRSAKRVSTGIIYTYSRSMNFFDNGPNTLTFAYPAYWDMNYARAGYDRTNNFQWWSIAPSPFGRSGSYLKSGIAGRILGGWQLQNVLSWYSGTPFTIGASGASLNAPGNAQVADKLVNRVSILGAHHFVGANRVYFDTTQVVQPTGARFGNSGRNSLRGPGLFNLDSGLKRRFPLYERSELVFQIEAFNVTNTPQFANPNATVGSSTLGTITGTVGSNRRLRLSARVTF